MTSAKPWIGSKRIAFVPVYRSNAVPPDQMPPDWMNVISNRVLNNPRPEANGADRSLRAWLRVVSSDVAGIDPVFINIQSVDNQDVEPWDLDGKPCEGLTLDGVTCHGLTIGQFLRNHGVEAAILLTLGKGGGGKNEGFWSRADMADSNGVWLMELIHAVTGFKDLYHFDDDVDPRWRAIDFFDEMAAASQTHPTAFTKNELGWLNGGTIKYHSDASANYSLQYISLPKPPTGQRVAAVRLGDHFPYIIVEARGKTDQFETGMPTTFNPLEFGIPSEGVIVYFVNTRNPTELPRQGHKLPLYLLTLTALKPGESIVQDEFEVTVTGTLPDGFTVHIKGPQGVPVPSVIGVNYHNARQAINQAGLVPIRRSGSVTNTVVVSQSPEGGDFAPLGSKVYLDMDKDQL